MTIVVFPNNTVSFRDSETEERLDNSYSYDEVKSMFGFTDIRSGNKFATPKKIFSNGHLCIVFPTSIVNTDGRESRVEYQREYRVRQRKKLESIQDAYEMKKEAVS